MASVTSVVSKTKQPQGGFLPLKWFEKVDFDDLYSLNENENIHASLVGLAVDYLTRLELGDPVEKVFDISGKGAYNIGMSAKADALMSGITGLDDHSIISACKLVGFDVCYRASPASYVPIESINPDLPTIENIRVMVWRSMAFWNKYGPVVCSEPTFEGGYTDAVNSGDGDFLTGNTLWDFKVSKKKPTTKHSLQILMYYIMGLHSIHDHFRSIVNLGFYNPRLNVAYICPVASIPEEIIREIEDNVLCYGITEGNGNYENIDDPYRDFTVPEIGTEAGVTVDQVVDDICAGKLTAYKENGHYFIEYGEAICYIKEIKSRKKRSIAISLVVVVISLLAVVYLMIKSGMLSGF